MAASLVDPFLHTFQEWITTFLFHFSISHSEIPPAFFLYSNPVSVAHITATITGSASHWLCVKLFVTHEPRIKESGLIAVSLCLNPTES